MIKKYIILSTTFIICSTMLSMHRSLPLIQFGSPRTIRVALEPRNFLLSQTELPIVLGDKKFTADTAKSYIKLCLYNANNSLTQPQLDALAEQLIKVIPTAKPIFNIQNPVQTRPVHGIQEQQSDMEKWSTALSAKL